MADQPNLDILPAPEGYGGPRYPYTGYYPGSEGEQPLHIKEVLAVLRRNKWLALSVVLVTFSLFAYAAVRQRPVYRAVATLQVNAGSKALTEGLDEQRSNASPGTDPLAAQIEVLRSRAVAADVVERAGLRLTSATRDFPAGELEEVALAPGFTADSVRLSFYADGYAASWSGVTVDAAYGEPIDSSGLRLAVAARPAVPGATLRLVPEDRAVDAVLGALSARARNGAGVIEIEYKHHDPRVAQRVANAAAAALEARSAHTAQREARRRRVFIEEQMVRMDSLLEHAQLDLGAFRSRQQGYSIRDRYAAERSGAMALEVRREELAADQKTYQALLERLESAPAGSTEGLRVLMSSPGLSSNPTISTLYAQLIQYETERNRLTAGQWGSAETNPDVQRLRSLIASTSAALVEAVRHHVASLDARMAALDDLRSRNAAQMQVLPGSEAEEARLELRVENARKMADQIREEYQKARIVEAAEAGQVEVLDWAPVPSKPVSGGPERKLFLGLLVGLVFGVGGALALEYMNTSIRHLWEVEGVLQVPRLAVVPQFGARGSGRAYLAYLAVRRRVSAHAAAFVPDASMNPLVTVSDLHSAGAEAYRTLRANLIFAPADTLTRVVVTSPSPGEGKTTTAANLAVAYAQQGMRVLLIDCDLRRPRLHSLFQTSMEPGLTEVLHGGVEPQDAVRASGIEGLWLLPCGMLTHNPAELLGSKRMRGLMDSFGERYDVVVLDTTPLLVASDAAILGTHADGVLLVVRAGRTERSAAQEALHQLTTMGARVVGAVLNGTDARAA